MTEDDEVGFYVDIDEIYCFSESPNNLIEIINFVQYLEKIGSTVNLDLAYCYLDSGAGEFPSPIDHPLFPRHLMFQKYETYFVVYYYGTENTIAKNLRGLLYDPYGICPY